ncbi:putative signal transduction protein [Escherichia coli]|nr:putative signal transduction protein [Escherichia coli]
MFGLLFTELNSAQAKIIAERMRKNVELLTGFSNRYDVPEQMTISIGTVFSTGDTRNISLVMTEADKALRRSEKRGGQQSDYSSYLSAKIFRAMLFAWLLHTIYYYYP